MSVPSEIPASTPHEHATGTVIVPHRPRWYQWIGAWFIFGLVRIVSGTLRYRWQDDSGYFEQTDIPPAIYCAWHNRLGLCMPAYFRFTRRRTRKTGLAAMVSASKDGGFLAAILECFKVQPVRGSTSRRGPQALLELTTWAERGFDLAITPDGPRGPCYQVQPGVIALAQITNLPIIPFSYYLHWKLRPNSWDKFQIPLPFSVCEMRLGPLLHIPREATEEQRETLRQELEHTLQALSQD